MFICLRATGGEKRDWVSSERVVQWGTRAESRAFFCSGRSGTEADSTAEDCQNLLIFLSLLLPFTCLYFHSLFVISPSTIIVCVSLIFLVSYCLLQTTFLFLSLPEFPLCRLFPLSSISVSYCPSFFPPSLCQSCGMFLIASYSTSLPSYALCYWCLTLTKGCSPGPDASQVSPSLLLDPWRFQIHKWQNLALFFFCFFFEKPCFP